MPTTSASVGASDRAWFQLHTFTNGVGAWWMTAMDVTTGRIAKAEGSRYDCQASARQVLFEALLRQRGGVE